MPENEVDAEKLLNYEEQPEEVQPEEVQEEPASEAELEALARPEQTPQREEKPVIRRGPARVVTKDKGKDGPSPLTQEYQGQALEVINFFKEVISDSPDLRVMLKKRKDGVYVFVKGGAMNYNPTQEEYEDFVQRICMKFGSGDYEVIFKAPKHFKMPPYTTHFTMADPEPMYPEYGQPGYGPLQQPWGVPQQPPDINMDDPIAKQALGEMSASQRTITSMLMQKVSEKDTMVKDLMARIDKMQSEMLAIVGKQPTAPALVAPPPDPLDQMAKMMGMITPLILKANASTTPVASVAAVDPMQSFQNSMAMISSMMNFTKQLTEGKIPDVSAGEEEEETVGKKMQNLAVKAVETFANRFAEKAADGVAPMMMGAMVPGAPTPQSIPQLSAQIPQPQPQPQPQPPTAEEIARQERIAKKQEQVGIILENAIGLLAQEGVTDDLIYDMLIKKGEEIKVDIPRYVFKHPEEKIIASFKEHPEGAKIPDERLKEFITFMKGKINV